jgi:hypothetical protein
MTKLQDARLGWMEACLRYTGRYGPAEKKAYEAHFGISESAVSRDQDLFVARCDAAIGAGVVVKSKGKLSIAEDAHLPEEPIFPLPDLRSWLPTILGSRSVSVTGFGRADPAPHVLRTVLRAIEDRVPVAILYASRSGGSEPAWRTVSPHAVADVAGRHHMRAHDHEKVRFGDFVLSRILACRPVSGSHARHIDGAEDAEWHEKIVIEIRERAGAPCQATRMDFGLGPDGTRRMKVRRALAPYVIDEVPEGYESPVTIKVFGKMEKMVG